MKISHFAYSFLLLVCATNVNAQMDSIEILFRDSLSRFPLRSMYGMIFINQSNDSIDVLTDMNGYGRVPINLKTAESYDFVFKIPGKMVCSSHKVGIMHLNSKEIEVRCDLSPSFAKKISDQAKTDIKYCDTKLYLIGDRSKIYYLNKTSTEKYGFKYEIKESLLDAPEILLTIHYVKHYNDIVKKYLELVNSKDWEKELSTDIQNKVLKDD